METIETKMKKIEELDMMRRQNLLNDHCERNPDLSKQIHDLQFEVVGEFLDFDIRKSYEQVKDRDPHKIYELSFKHQYGGKFDDIEMGIVYKYLMRKDAKSWDGKNMLPDERERMAKLEFKHCAYFMVGNIVKIKVYQ